MVVDIRLSADGMAEFQEQLSSLSLSLPLSFSTLVLQSAAWPLSRMSCGFAVPTELLPVIEKVSGWGQGVKSLVPVPFSWADVCTCAHSVLSTISTVLIRACIVHCICDWVLMRIYVLRLLLIDYY